MWGYIFSSSTSSRSLEQKLFYPLLGLLAVTSFFQMVYDSSMTLSIGIIIAIIQFVSYYAAYVISSLCISFFLPYTQEQGKTTSDGRIRVLVLYCMSIMVILDIIQNFLPAEYILLNIIPVYIIYLVLCCSSYFHVRKDKELLFVIAAFCMIVFVPIVLSVLLTKLMPQ